ncbi:MAG: hypothetical protein LPJ98_01155 [Cyclobacteriaceae bacterium]|jgi:hypothetical protein|nr:hypothetical protein [Cyclobacteriaceae bacterium]
MIQELQRRFKVFIRLMACMMALFFVVLAVFDGFEEVESYEFFSGFEVDETEFDYVDFPTSISRPSGSKVSKVQRVEVVKIFDQIQSILPYQVFTVIIPVFDEKTIFQFIQLIIQHAVCANAP